MKTGKNKALFLDRDGVINLDHVHVRDQEKFHFQEGIFELCRDAQKLGYLLLVITNQGGIARGYYSESHFLELTAWMVRKFDERQIRIDRVYYCPYHPTEGISRYRFDSADRKPKPGMLLRARADFNLDMASSVLVGDQMTDIRAADAAGVGTKILLQPGSAKTPTAEDKYRVLDSLETIRLKFFSLGPSDGNKRSRSLDAGKPPPAVARRSDRKAKGQKGPRR